MICENLGLDGLFRFGALLSLARPIDLEVRAA